MTQREQIEKLKQDFQASLENNSPKYRRAIIRELDFLYRKYGRENIDIFYTVVEKLFDIPATSKAEILKELKTAQAQIGQLWDGYFADSMELFNVMDANDFEKLQALYNVDFPKIKESTREIILKEIGRAARAEASYDVVRSRLLKRGLGDAEARTLANTALAQFDNATMFEFAKQAGIEKFKYDGVLHPNSRPFCKEHLGKKYTLAQISKMDNMQGLPVSTSCGGYNCTHFWTPVITK